MAGNELLAKSDVLQRLKRFFDVFQENMENYPYVIDLHTGVAMVARRMVEYFDLPGEIVTDFHNLWKPLIYSEDLPKYESTLEEAFAAGSTLSYDLEYRVKNSDGQYGWVWGRGSTSFDADGQPDFFVGVIMRMDWVLHADPVTGLLNRYAFEMDLKNVVQRAEEEKASGAVITVGLDNFHILYDTYDHAYSDSVMKEIGVSIANVLPSHLNLYKLEGDAFAIIWPDVTPDEIAIIFAGIQICLRELKTMNDKVYFSASAGVVFYPESGYDTRALYRYSQAALQMAQQRGKEQLSFFSHEEYQEWLKFTNLQRSFEDSIERGCEGFLLYYQPQVDAKTQKLIGCEALLRWQEPTGEIISPVVFIPILERTRLIVPVGSWVVNEAIRTCKEWQKYSPGFEMSVNVSLCQLETFDFHSVVEEALQRYDLPPECLTLELTESQSVSNWDFVNDQFDRFRKMGVKVAMDDFGVGNSSLALLKNFNCDILKVDKVFVDDILVSEFDRKLVKSTVQLCQSIGMTVCIEGVEEKEAYEYLANECDVDVIQGFYFGRPEPKDIFEQRFAK